MNEATVFKPEKGILEKKLLSEYKINSIYNFEKINSLFKNFDTMSFLDLLVNYKNLLKTVIISLSLIKVYILCLVCKAFISVFNDRFSSNLNHEHT